MGERRHGDPAQIGPELIGEDLRGWRVGCHGPLASVRLAGIQARHATAVATGAEGKRMGSILGNRVVRVEDPRMLTAGGTYVEDVDIPGAVWLTYVRSPIAHGRIVAIDASAAKEAPGVLAV